MSRELIDRETELERLRTLAERDGQTMALITGRRRVGKTFLLRHTWPERPVFHFTASNISAEQNRHALLTEAARWAETDLRPKDYPSWRTALRAILELRPDDPMVVVLDEVQYLAENPREMSEFASELNAAWEGDLRRAAALLLVLSGSAITTLDALNEGDAALHGRFDWHGKLTPFDYYRASQMLSGYSRDEQIEAYGAVGGTPLYLDAVNTGRSLEENVVDLLLTPDGMVRGQVETAIEQELGLRDVATYRGILAAVGQGRPTAGEVASKIGAKKDRSLERKLDRLIDLDYLERMRNFEAPGNQAYRYRLADPAFRFYYGLVVPNESAIDTAGPEAVWRKRISPEAWLSYIGQHVFEDVVEQAYLRVQDDRDVPEVVDWSYWQGEDPNREPLEIDVVCRLLDGRMLTGSIKYQSRPADATAWLEHQESLRRLEGSGRRWVHEALEPEAPFLFVSRSGFTESFRRVRSDYGKRPVITWELDDLFE